MSVRHALLALLSGRAMTGYEISTQFGRSVGHVWHAPDSQIYPALRELAGADLLDVEELSDAGRGTKKRYHLTDAGIDSLREWLSTSSTPRPQREPIFLQAAYFEWVPAEDVVTILSQHARFQHQQRHLFEHTREMLLDGTHPTLASRLECYPAAQRNRIIAWKVFAYDGLIARAQSEAEWAERGIELASQFLDADPLHGRAGAPSRYE